MSCMFSILWTQYFLSSSGFHLSEAAQDEFTCLMNGLLGREDQASVIFREGRRCTVRLLCGHDRYIPRDGILVLDRRVE